MYDEEEQLKADFDYLPRSVTNCWQVIPLSGKEDANTVRDIHRLNSQGSLYYHLKLILGKKRLQNNPIHSQNLHYLMCQTVEKDGLKEVIEIPRAHFKSTIYSEGLPNWRALPFTIKDESLMRAIGYGDRWIQWMKYCHNQDIRILIISEVIKNAIKLGTKLKSHHESNDIFKYLYPEIIPQTGGTWNNESLHQNRTAAGKIHGEGTFDFTGVGGALQSRHYNMLIEDDMFGRESKDSETMRDKVIDYHQLLVGVLDSEENEPDREQDEIIVGNRWAFNDLNSWVRLNEPEFRFTTHSAIGGCCPLHPIGQTIFPEAFSARKLAIWKKRLGNINFSCQFLNVPIDPNEVKFKLSNIRRFEFTKDKSFQYQMADGELRYKALIHHHVTKGDVIPDIAPRNLKRYMIVDPNHSGNTGRCRHAITITGVQDDPRRIYLLAVWAKATSVEEFIDEIFRLAQVWLLDEVYLETIAAQKYLKYLLEEKQKSSGSELVRNLRFRELNTPKTKNAKQLRIDSLGPIFERGDFWANSFGQEEFFEELETYPNGILRDVLDTLGYGPQVWKFDDSNTDDLERDIRRRLAIYTRNIQRTSRVSGY
jgi:hypothetical protein